MSLTALIREQVHQRAISYASLLTRIAVAISLE
jgi:hypothetical protein